MISECARSKNTISFLRAFFYFSSQSNQFLDIEDDEVWNNKHRRMRVWYCYDKSGIIFSKYLSSKLSKVH